MHQLINSARADAGLGALGLSSSLSSKARKHSAAMADQRRLVHHRCLSCTFGGSGWSVLGENVGAGSSVGAVHRKMLRSAGHRDNILRNGYDRVGIGIVRARGLVWVTEIFAG
jgi:uncharacterized protein YkwD